MRLRTLVLREIFERKSQLLRNYLKSSKRHWRRYHSRPHAN
jgi:hypothetical protein